MKASYANEIEKLMRTIGATTLLVDMTEAAEAKTAEALEAAKAAKKKKK